jgi:dephospho-CoA kinase
MLLAITGRLGSGKSTALEIFSQLGAVTLDADQLVHELYADANSKMYRAVAQEFGAKILNANQTIDRQKLRALVVADPEKLARLNLIVHPLLVAELDRRIANFPSNKIGVVEIALLSQIRLRHKFDKIILVRAPLKICAERMRERGWSEAETEKIWHAQKEHEAPDFVIENYGAEEKLEDEVKSIFELLN